MSDFTHISTPSDLVAFNKSVQEPVGITVEVGTDPQKDLQVALNIIEQLYNWHVNESDSASKGGELNRAQSWAQDAGILLTVYNTLNNFEV